MENMPKSLKKSKTTVTKRKRVSSEESSGEVSDDSYTKVRKKKQHSKENKRFKKKESGSEDDSRRLKTNGCGKKHEKIGKDSEEDSGSNEDEVMLLDDDVDGKEEKIKVKDPNNNKVSKEKNTKSLNKKRRVDKSEKEMFEDEIQTKNNESHSESDSDDNLMILKSKLKEFEKSVGTRPENQTKNITIEQNSSNSDSNGDQGSVKKEYMNSSSDSSAKKKHFHGKSKKDDDSEDEKLTATKKNGKHNSSDEDSSDSDSDDAETPLRNLSMKASGRKDTKEHVSKMSNEDSDASDDSDERVISHKKKKRENAKEDKKSNHKDKEESSKLKGLKRYVRACGMRVNCYPKLFEDCHSMKAKERKLERYIKDITGIEDRITLVKCKKYKAKKERADELAELDVNKIIGTPAKGKRLTRQSSSTVVRKHATASPAGKDVFANFRDLFDSEESEGEKCAGKSKKTILLDSDEDSSDDVIMKMKESGEENKERKMVGKAKVQSDGSDNENVV